MAEKRSKQIAVRVTAATYETLAQEAKVLKWSIAQLANEILVKWAEDHGGQ